MTNGNKTKIFIQKMIKIIKVCVTGWLSMSYTHLKFCNENARNSLITNQLRTFSILKLYN